MAGTMINQKKTAVAQCNVPTANSNEQNQTLPYYIRNDRLVKAPETDGEKELDVGRAIKIVEIHHDVDSKTVKLVLEYHYLDGAHTLEITRDVLNRNKILNLMTHGADVNDSNYAHVLKYLLKQEETITPTQIHSKLGFDFNNKEGLSFKHYKTIGGGDSTYGGTFNIKPAGTRKKWLSIVREEVLGYPPLELALVLGLAAPVASLIGKHTGLDVLIFHLFGNSSRGKTTASMLAVSPFGSPNPRDDGSLIKNWNTTTNALFGDLINVHGIPIAFDEASMKSSEFTNVIYILASGREKGRLDKNSKKKATSSWSGAFLSNGEHALTAKSVKNIGIEMRITEFGNISWTKSAKHADTLKKGIFSNYGHAGVIFVRWLLGQDLTNILARWNKCKAAFEAEISTPDHFASRLADRMAILLVTAEMAKEALNLDFSLPDLKTILFQTVQENNSNRNLSEKAYLYFLDKVLEHNGNFSTSKSHTPVQLWGKIVKHSKTGEWREIWILPEKFREIMQDGNFEDVRVVLNEWKTKEVLDFDSGRLTREKRIVPGLEKNVYVIKVLKSI